MKPTHPDPRVSRPPKWERRKTINPRPFAESDLLSLKRHRVPSLPTNISESRERARAASESVSHGSLLEELHAGVLVRACVGHDFELALELQDSTSSESSAVQSNQYLT